MNPRNTWLWLLAAAGLFAVIFLLDRFLPKPPAGPQKVIPGLSAAAVVSLQIQPAGQRTIRAERTNGGWQLTEPLLYPAPSTNIEALLVALQQLTAAAYVTPAELKDHPQANQEYGFDPPQASLVLDQRDSQSRIWVGHQTAPGDQVFLQVVGNEGIHVVDAGLLKLIPRTDKDWRETALADWPHLEFDHLSATNGAQILELQRNPTNRLWIIHHPLDARADSDKVERSLANLHNLRAREFVSDEPKPDLEAFGLLTPDLTLTFFQGTNSVLMLQFGKSQGTNANLIYAKRADRNTIVTVDRKLLEPWRASQDFRDFVDPHLVSLTVPLDRIKVIAQDEFTLQRRTNDTWRIVRQDLQDLPADVRVMGDVISQLTNMQVKIFRDVVPEQDWPTYGLATPARQYLLNAAPADAGEGSTNPPLAQISFGIVNGTNVFARQSGETFVYAVDPNDLDRLPSASFQMRDRRIWNFSEDQVARLTIQQDGKTRDLIRNGTNSWSLGTNSIGMINPLAINEAAVQLGQLAAGRWVERGDTNRVQLGISTNAYRLTVELKDGRKLSVEIGDPQPPGIPNAIVTLEGEPWTFAFPWPLYFQYVKPYLFIPPYAR